MIFDRLVETNITVAYLKRHGYRRIVWGSPDYYVELPKDERGHTKFTGKRESTARWNKNSYAWEKIGVGYCDFVYFPKGFNKYVNAGCGSHRPENAVLAVNHGGSWSETKLFNDVFTINDLESVELSVL